MHLFKFLILGSLTVTLLMMTTISQSVKFLVTCPMCSHRAPFESMNSFITHLTLRHRADPNFWVECGFDGCSRTYKNFHSFRSHIFRSHVRDGTTGQRNSTENINFPLVPENDRKQEQHIYCNLKSCEKELMDIKELIIHMGQHMDNDEQCQVECMFKECSKSFRVYSSLRSHISRCHSKHRNLFSTLKDDFVKKSDVNYSTNFYSDTDYLYNVEENASDLGHTLFETDENADKQDFLHTLACMLLKIQESNCLPVSTMDTIVHEVGDLCNLAFMQTQIDVKNTLIRKGASSDIITCVEDIFAKNIMKDCISILKTEELRNTYWKQSLSFVEPMTVSLGRNSAHIEKSFQYIPILDSISRMLQQEDVLSEVMNSHNSSDKTLLDFCDGNYFKQNALFSQHPNALQIILYFDEFEVVNPIGARKGIHKIAAVYFTLGNLSPNRRSEVHPIQLGILCANKDLKEFGFENILKLLVQDIKKLETEGMVVPSTQHKIFGTVAFVVADNLGSHQIGGFVESFHSKVKYSCRFCLARSDEIQNLFDDACFEYRNKENYMKCIDELNESEENNKCGVKSNSKLNELKYFHVTTGLPPDCMHDLLEGVARNELPLVLNLLESRGYITARGVIDTFKTWKYGMYDKLSKPSIPTKITSFSQTASQMWTLIRLLPLMLGRSVPEDDHAWEILLLLKDITEISLSPKLTFAMCAYLKSLIIDHHKLLREIFPNETLKAKHHFLIHYPEMIMNFGPLRTCWCMRFEAKHKYFKQLASRLGNFKNINSTLAKRHQNMQAYLTSGNTNELFKPESEVLKSTTIDVKSLDKSVAQALLDNGVTSSTLAQHERIFFNGHNYKPGTFLIFELNCKLEEPVFAKVVSMFAYQKKTLFVVAAYDSIYHSHLRAYKLRDKDKVVACEMKRIFDLTPLDSYRQGGNLFVVLKHAVVFS